jgi:hypothetical protein
MKIKAVSLLLATSILLTGCTGPGDVFEHRTYGVRDSVWTNMSDSERYATKHSYILEQQRLQEQRRVNAMLDAKEAELTRVRDQRYRLEQDRINSQNARNAEDHQRRLLNEQQRINAENDRRYREQQQHQPRLGGINEHVAPAVVAPQISQEQRDLEEAQRRSLITQREDEARRQAARAQEQRDIEEATRRSMETYNQEQAARQVANAAAPAAAANHNWQPNEGQLVRGGELVMGLQREIGRQPSSGEMQNRLQSHMGLSSAQATKVLEELGLV